MDRHCENAMELAQWLEDHDDVSRVYYPGLESHPDHDLAAEQMDAFGGMLSFEFDGTLEQGARQSSVRRKCSPSRSRSAASRA